MFPVAGAAKIVVIIHDSLIALADTTHIVVGSSRSFIWCLMEICPGATLSGFALPTGGKYLWRDLHLRTAEPCADP